MIRTFCYRTHVPANPGVALFIGVTDCTEELSLVRAHQQKAPEFVERETQYYHTPYIVNFKQLGLHMKQIVSISK